MNPPYLFYRNSSYQFYTEVEIILCYYVARFDNQISIQDIITISMRPNASITFKIRNIISMLIRNNFGYNISFTAINGMHQGDPQRQTNWDTIQDYLDFPQNVLLEHCHQIINNPTYI